MGIIIAIMQLMFATIIAGKNKAPDWLDHDGGVAPNAHIGSYLYSKVSGVLLILSGYQIVLKLKWLIWQQVMVSL